MVIAPAEYAYDTSWLRYKTVEPLHCDGGPGKFPFRCALKGLRSPSIAYLLSICIVL